MPMVYDGDGNEVADIEISEKQRKVLATGESVVMIYNTPQMLRHLLGEKSGSFTLLQVGDKTIAIEPHVLRDYASLQRAIKAAR